MRPSVAWELGDLKIIPWNLINRNHPPNASWCFQTEAPTMRADYWLWLISGCETTSNGNGNETSWSQLMVFASKVRITLEESLRAPAMSFEKTMHVIDKGDFWFFVFGNYLWYFSNCYKLQFQKLIFTHGRILIDIYNFDSPSSNIQYSCWYQIWTNLSKKAKK